MNTAAETYSHTAPCLADLFQAFFPTQLFYHSGVSLKLQLCLLFHSKMPQDSATWLKLHASPGTARFCSRAKRSMGGHMATSRQVILMSACSYFFNPHMLMSAAVLLLHTSKISQAVKACALLSTVATWGREKQTTVCIILSAISE